MDEIQKSLSDKRLSQRQHIFNSFFKEEEVGDIKKSEYELSARQILSFRF